MICPECKGKTKVTDSRAHAEGALIKRRRLCLNCGLRFTTYEEQYKRKNKQRANGRVQRSSYIYKKDNKYEVDLFEDDKLIKKVDMRNYPISHARFVAEMWFMGLTNYITKRRKK